MAWFMFPALIGLSVKVLVLWFYHRKIRSMSRVFICLVFAFALHNISELMVFFSYLDYLPPEPILRLYYVVTSAAAALLCLYAIEVSAIDRLNIVRPYIIAWCLIVALMAMMSDLLVSGSKPLDYVFGGARGVTAVPGDYYWLFQVMILGMSAFVVAVLSMAYQKTLKNRVQVRCLYTLLCLSPLLILSGVVVILMSLGIRVNGMILGPFASTASLVMLMIKTEFEHNVVDVRGIIPFSPERRVTREIRSVVSDYAMEKLTHKSAMSDIEKIMVIYKNEKTGNNVSKTAESMGLPRSTVYAIYKRLGISRNE